MKTALKIVLIGAALVLGVFLAAMVLFSAPNFFGLRPHAVKPGLDNHSTEDLLALAEHGPVTGILTYDAWYKDRDGQTGWFLLPPNTTESLPFAVNGLLDPGLSKLFGTAPRRCNGTPYPEKMIRAVEPARTKAGFLGRSECNRAKMDISAVIAASTPVVRHDDYLTHAELTAFDADTNPLRVRENVQVWPTPYAYHRTISLPLVWQRWPGDSDSKKVDDLVAQARALAQTLTREGEIALQVHQETWTPRKIEELTQELFPYERGGTTVLVGEIEVRRIDVIVLCAPYARKQCDAVDVSGLMEAAGKLRDTAVLDRALAAAQPVPDGLFGFRDILREAEVLRTQLHAPTSQERRFSVIWYENPTP